MADAIEGQGKLGDFIIPVRIDNIPFSDIPIQIHNKNVIDFTVGWHDGLARILKKFEQDKVPESGTNLASSLSDWAKADGKDSGPAALRGRLNSVGLRVQNNRSSNPRTFNRSVSRLLLCRRQSILVGVVAAVVFDC